MDPRLLPRVATVALVLAGACSACRADDPLESTGCSRALDALQAQETAAAALQPSEGPAHGAALARLKSLRQEAAHACLGGSAAVLVPQRLAQPPVTVPRVTVTPRVPPVPPAVAPPPAPPQGVVGPPVRVIACDATGCWASDGSRLLRAGPGLLGPRGLIPSIAKSYLSFYRKDFHPWDHDDRHLIDAWKASQVKTVA